MNIHTTHHIYKIALRKKWFWKYFFLEIPPVQPLSLMLMFMYKHDNRELGKNLYPHAFVMNDLISDIRS